MPPDLFRRLFRHRPYRGATGRNQAGLPIRCAGRGGSCRQAACRVLCRGPDVQLPDSAIPGVLASLDAAGAEYLSMDDQYLEANPVLRRATEVGVRVLRRTHCGGHSATVYAPEGPELAPMSRAR